MTITVIVGEGQTEPFSWLVDAKFRRNLCKVAISVVVIDERRNGRKHVRMTVSAETIAMLATPNVLKIPLQITKHHQVQQAIGVEIDPGSARRPTASTHASLLRHVGKRAVPIIVVKLVASVGRDVEVFVSIVIVVCDGSPHAVADTLQSSPLRDVLKRSVFVLVVEPIPIRRSIFLR